jgi:hypothetical protein
MKQFQMMELMIGEGQMLEAVEPNEELRRKIDFAIPQGWADANRDTINVRDYVWDYRTASHGEPFNVVEAYKAIRPLLLLAELEKAIVKDSMKSAINILEAFNTGSWI